MSTRERDGAATVRHAVVEWDGTLRPRGTLAGWVGHLVGAGIVSQDASAAVVGLVEAPAPVDEAIAAYAALLTGQATAAIEAAALAYATTILGHLYPHTRPLIALLHEHGLVVTVTSDAPSEVLGAVASTLGLDRVLSPVLGVESCTYTGVVEDLPGSPTRREALVGAIRGAGDELVVGIGDAATNAPVLEAATLAISVEHTPRRIEPMLRIGHRPVDVAAIRAALSS